MFKTGGLNMLTVASQLKSVPSAEMIFLSMEDALIKDVRGKLFPSALLANQRKNLNYIGKLFLML